MTMCADGVMLAEGDGPEPSGEDVAGRFLDATLLVLLLSAPGESRVGPPVVSVSPSRFSNPSMRFSSSSSTSVFGPRFLGTASTGLSSLDRFLRTRECGGNGMGYDGMGRDGMDGSTIDALAAKNVAGVA